jgi:hypothetical protein
MYLSKVFIHTDVHPIISFHTIPPLLYHPSHLIYYHHSRLVHLIPSHSISPVPFISIHTIYPFIPYEYMQASIYLYITYLSIQAPGYP